MNRIDFDLYFIATFATLMLGLIAFRDELVLFGGERGFLFVWSIATLIFVIGTIIFYVRSKRSLKTTLVRKNY